MSSISGGPTKISPNLSVGSVEKTGAATQVQTQSAVKNNLMEAMVANQGMQLGDMNEMMAMLMSKMNEMQGPSSKAQIQDTIANRKAQLNEMQAKLDAASGNAQQLKDQANLTLTNSMVQATMSLTQGLMGQLNPFGKLGAGMKMPPPPPPPNTLAGIMAKAQQQLGMPKVPNPFDTLMKFQQPPQSPQNLVNSLLKGPLSPPGSSQKLNPPAPPAKTDAQTLQDMQNTMNELIKKTQSQAATTTALMDKMMGSMNNMLSTMQNMQNKSGF